MLLGSTNSFLACRSSNVIPKRSAMASSVSPGCTVYVCGAGVGVGVAAGVGVGVGVGLSRVSGVAVAVSVGRPMPPPSVACV